MKGTRLAGATVGEQEQQSLEHILCGCIHDV